MTSCARVNGKPVDREKQIKYDIAKNEDGPLTRTAVKKPLLADSSAASTSVVVPEDVSSTSRVETPALEQSPRKKRRLGEVEEESAKSTANARTPSKGKRKAKERQPTSVRISSPSDQPGNEALSTKFMADMDERMVNVEEHLAVRYGKSPSCASFLRDPNIFLGLCITQYLLCQEHYLPDSNTWKITSSDLRRSTRLGRLCISISQIEG